MTNSLKFNLFLISKLPMGFLAGLKIDQLNEDSATVALKYGYLTKNPFRSIYFACLAMGAELASGALSMGHVLQQNKSISMLVVAMEASFKKKAVGSIRFVCNDGQAIKSAVLETVQTGEGTVVKAVSIGIDEKNEEVARFIFTWSFKKK